MEAAATMLYTLGANILILGEDKCIALTHDLKGHIHFDVILSAYDAINEFKLYEIHPEITKEDVDCLQQEVLGKIKCLDESFGEYEISRNQIIVT